MMIADIRELICSIDQGTSSTRVMIFNKSGEIMSSHQMELTQVYPQAGSVEHNPEEIWQCCLTCLRESLRPLGDSIKIVAVGITNQRETTVVWNKFTGKPYHNAIVWNDTRTANICDQYSSLPCKFTKEVGKDRFRSKTGLPISTYFSVTKLRYLLDTVPLLKQDAKNGTALFGTIDTWLIWNLTNGFVHATDVTNASRTLLMNIHELNWDDDLLNFFKIPGQMLPGIRSSSEIYGRIDCGVPMLKGVPISGVLGDQHAALFGQTCFTRGEAKCTYGTGAFLLMNTGESAVSSVNGLLTTLAFQIGRHGPPQYALEGSVAYCGSTIQWLRDNLQIIPDVASSETYALEATDNGGVYFVPAFSGLFAPYWDDSARGVIVGLTAYNTRAHICRAALEACAFQVDEIVSAMVTDAGLAISSLKVDGGLTQNTTTMQFQSNILNVTLSRPLVAETTVLGAAFAAGLAVGYWRDTDELRRIWKSASEWNPKIDLSNRLTLRGAWKEAVKRSLGLRKAVTSSVTQPQSNKKEEVIHPHSKLLLVSALVIMFTIGISRHK